MRHTIAWIMVGLGIVSSVAAVIFPQTSTLLHVLIDTVLGLALAGAVVMGIVSKAQAKRPVGSGLVAGLFYSIFAYFHEIIKVRHVSRQEAIAILKRGHQAITSAHIHSLTSVGTHVGTRIGGYLLAVFLTTLACLILAGLGSLFVKGPKPNRQEVY